MKFNALKKKFHIETDTPLPVCKLPAAPVDRIVSYAQFSMKPGDEQCGNCRRIYAKTPERFSK